jgi:hypothetical protein
MPQMNQVVREPQPVAMVEAEYTQVELEARKLEHLPAGMVEAEAEYLDQVNQQLHIIPE